MFIKGTGPMRNHWKALIPIAISFMTLAGCGQGERVETPLRPAPPARFCDPQTARVLGRAYVFSIPTANAERLVNFIQQNKSYFVEDAAVIKCARALGNRLVHQGITSFSQGDYDRAYGRTLEMGGDMDQARSVANSISSGSVDLYMMGQELIWLSEVLPYAANENWEPFATTGTQTRNQIRQVLPLLGAMMQMDPEMAQVVNSVMKQFEPIAEEQIVMLAIMSGV